MAGTHNSLLDSGPIASQGQQVAGNGQCAIADRVDHEPSAPGKRRGETYEKHHGRLRYPPKYAEMRLRDCHKRIGLPVAGKREADVRGHDISELEADKKRDQNQPCRATTHDRSPHRACRSDAPTERAWLWHRVDRNQDGVTHPLLRWAIVTPQSCDPTNQKTVKPRHAFLREQYKHRLIAG